MGLADSVVPVGLSAADLARGAEKKLKYVYRPAAVARLTIRLEDFTNDDGADAQPEGKPAKTAAAKAAQALASLKALQAVRRASGVSDLAADARVAAAQRRANGRSGVGASPAAPLDAGLDDHTVQICVVPLGLRLGLNGFKIADTLSMDLQLSDLPLIPDVIRSMFIEVWFGTVDADSYGNPQNWIPQLFHTPPVFRGYVDDDTLEATDDDLKTTVTAKSLEARLMELKINPLTKARQVAHGGEDLADYVRRLVSTIPEFNGSFGQAIGVRYFPNVDQAKAPRIDPKKLKRSLQTASSRSQVGGPVQAAPPGDPAQDPGGGVAAGVGMATPNPTIEVTVWDLVTRAALLGGMLAVYDPSIVVTEPDGSVTALGANNILLVPPQNIKETPHGGIEIPGGPADGFARELTIGGSTVKTQVRFFVWGNNVASYKVSRRYGRGKTPRVRVICHNPDGPPGQRTLEAVFPKTTRATKVPAVGTGQPGGAQGHQPVEEEVVRVIRETRSQAELERIAVALYHTISRHETVVNIETNELCSYLDPTRPESHNENPDLLRLRAGAVCRVVVARGNTWDPVTGPPVVSGLSELMDRRANPAFLRRALLENPNSSAFIAQGQRSKMEAMLGKIEAAYQSSKLTDWFYVRSVEYRWSAEDGFQLSVELAGFQEARNLPANLGPDDNKANDQLKKVVSGKKPDARAAAIQANKDAVLLRLAEAARGPR